MLVPDTQVDIDAIPVHKPSCRSIMACGQAVVWACRLYYPMTQAGRQAKTAGTEGTFWRRRGLVWPSPWGSYRLRQGRGIIIIACIGAPCPCRPVIIGLSWRPITIGVLPVQRWCCKHSSMFQPILALPRSRVDCSLTAACQSTAAYLSGL